MKKKIFGKKLSRDVGARRGLFIALTKALVERGKIKTTKAKSKAFQAEIDKVVRLAKENTLSARRKVYAMLGADREIAERIFGEIAPSFADKVSGFTRIINLPQRKGDNAPMVSFEWSKKFEIKSKEVDKKTTKEKAKKEEKAKIPKKGK